MPPLGNEKTAQESKEKRRRDRLLEAIKQRRSIRKYLPREIKREIIIELIEAACWAPSPHNAQPGRFIIITEKEKKRIIGK